MDIVLTILWGAVAAWSVRQLGTSPSRAAALPPAGVLPRTSRVTGRILFLTRAGDDLVLDCVAGTDHPARSQALPGSPFTVRVSAFGSTWFADAMERFLERLAVEDREVTFELATGPDGDRVDVRSEATRMRFDLRSRVGLT